MNTRSRISHFLAAAAFALTAGLAAAAASAASIGAAQTRGDRATQMLFDAVHTNDFTAAEAAVAAGANVEARDRWDISAIELAIDKGYFRIAHFLVSVRNSRSPVTEAASLAQPSPPVKQGQAKAAAEPAKRVAPPPAKVEPQEKVATPPQWPTDQPNPFDPAAPAFGTALPIIPAARAAPTGTAAESGDGPMLANDEATRGSREALR